MTIERVLVHSGLPVTKGEDPQSADRFVHPLHPGDAREVPAASREPALGDRRQAGTPGLKSGQYPSRDVSVPRSKELRPRGDASPPRGSCVAARPVH